MKGSTLGLFILWFLLMLLGIALLITGVILHNTGVTIAGGVLIGAFGITFLVWLTVGCSCGCHDYNPA